MAEPVQAYKLHVVCGNCQFDGYIVLPRAELTPFDRCPDCGMDDYMDEVEEGPAQRGH